MLSTESNEDTFPVDVTSLQQTWREQVRESNDLQVDGDEEDQQDALLDKLCKINKSVTRYCCTKFCL